MQITPIMLTLLGVVISPLLVKIAGKRALRQPLAAHLDEERRILATVLRNPASYAYIHQLEAIHFVDEQIGAIWALIKKNTSHITFPEARDNKEATFNKLAKAGVAVPGNLNDLVRGKANDQVFLNNILANNKNLERRELLRQATMVYSAGCDRTEYRGKCIVERTGDDRQPLRRVPAKIGVGRHLVTMLLTGIGFYIAGAISLHGTEDNVLGDPSQMLIIAGLCALTIGSVLWTLVDVDTMYIDMQTFHIFGGLAWIFVIANTLVNHQLGNALRGIVVAGGIIVFIEIINRVYRIIRGQDGMGGGDYLIIVATIGVPVAITGSWAVGQAILILSLLAGLVGWVLRRVTEPGFNRTTPYAFGPYLACGWMLGLTLWLVW